VPASAVVVGRDDLFAYLREPVDGPALRGYQVHWQLANDPEVRLQLGYDWTRIDYIVLSQHQLKDFNGTDNWLALTALRHAHLVASWSAVLGSPLHWDQHIEIWEADRLTDPNPSAFSAWLTPGRGQLCGVRVASCDEVPAPPPWLRVDTAAQPELLEPR
ncbi:MAG: hypothetical protein QOH08_2539, partial [Chloroflexota bacterium]|jgi:hypothetical protein|nr:hypothetical protein [Chloroflexota bacterium]